MAKRLLYLEDLYDFYSNTYKRSTRFNADDSGDPIVVHVHGKVNFEKSDKNTEGLLPVHLQACHTNTNLNGSNISDAVMTSALPSFSNRPILGYIHEVNGQWEFYSHNMHEDENGEVVYDEHPIGIVPESCNAQLVYDEDKKKTYCEVDGYIFEEYSKAAEILQREEECSVSVELSIRSLSYNAKEKYLDIEDFFFSGVTILGKTPDGAVVNPGMANSNIKLADFSSRNNSLFEKYESKMAEFQNRLEELEAANFNKKADPIQTLSKKGGDRGNMTKFEELLAKYGKTAEDITFDYAEMSDEELEAKFAELFADAGTSEPVADDPQKFAKLVRTYEISHEDIRYALYQLLESFESSDNEWYFINSVYDDHFTYENWNGDKIYGQNYTKDGDNVAFDGERFALHRELLTDSEFAELQSMRSNYASLKDFKENAEKNELHSKKETLLADEKYSMLADNEQFQALVADMDKYDLTELENRAKIIKCDYADSINAFSLNEPKNKPAGKVGYSLEKPKSTDKYYKTLFK